MSLIIKNIDRFSDSYFLSARKDQYKREMVEKRRKARAAAVGGFPCVPTTASFNFFQYFTLFDFFKIKVMVWAANKGRLKNTDSGWEIDLGFMLICIKSKNWSL